MANADTVMKLLRYAPAVLNLVQGVRAQPSQEKAKEAQRELDQFEKSVDSRFKDTEKNFDEIHHEMGLMRQRMKDIESTNTLLQMIAWSALAFGVTGFVISLVALLANR